MKTPPKMISTKDILYFSDVFNVNRAFIKKLDHYNTLVKDSKIKAHLKTVRLALNNHYKTLLEVLNNA